jgi:hypothetical protein
MARIRRARRAQAPLFALLRLSHNASQDVNGSGGQDGNG